MNKPITFIVKYKLKTLEDLPKLKEIMEAVGMNPNSTCGFLQTLSSPTTPLPSASLPIGSAVNVSFNILAQ